ncbi:uncharacterized protein LOC123529298 [Mercenaria mercenaria]|uniref:uncharacterized protein LOC123529298 n=1 Tax=Mercenaria mercenaria TaxID=6596 RepID=UPI00234EF8B3|nr:uncharacterized protein LOC123529298 [Mercenaria mercenaria]
MDTTFIPAFFLSSNGSMITSRFVEFGKYCTFFADEIIEGRDPSAKILTKLTKFPPLRDVPEMNRAFDLLKDSAFAYHMASVRDYFELGIKVHQSGDYVGQNFVPCDVSGERKKYDLFLPKKTLAVCRKTFWELKQTCYDHKAAVQRLQGAVKTYEDLKRKCIEACRNLQSSTNEFYAYTNNTEHPTALGQESLHVHQKCAQLSKEYIKCKEKTKKAQEKLESLYKTEKKIREEKLNKLEEELRSVIQTKMKDTLSEGLKILRKVANAARFPKKLTEMLESFDCNKAAAKLYKDLSVNYIHPVVDQSRPDMLLGRASFTYDDVYVMDKEEQRFRSDGSYISVLEGAVHESRQEELYVWANTGLHETDEQSQLKFKMDTKIKQKFCSADGNLAFGWTRQFGRIKQYGFFPTRATRLVR